MPDLSPTWAAYQAVTDALMHLRGQVAEIEMARIERKAIAYDMSEATSATGRKQDGDRATLDLDREMANLRGQVLAKEDLRQFIERAIDRGVEVVDDGGT